MHAAHHIIILINDSLPAVHVRASHIASWGRLLVQLALQPHERGYVLHVRAGLEGIPLDVSVHCITRKIILFLLG